MALDSFAYLCAAERLEGDKSVVCADYARYAEFAALYGDGVYAPLCDEAIKDGVRRIYVPSLDLPDKTVDALIDYVLSTDTRLKVTCSRTLEEAGIIDSRFSRSPVMLLYDFGLLERSEIVSGVYLDKDDLSLMAQEGASLTALPTADAGGGYGVFPAVAALERGVRVKLGSGEGEFNPSRDIIYEAAALGLLVGAQMNKKHAISYTELAEMCLASDCSGKDIEDTARKIRDNKFTPVYRR